MWGISCKFERLIASQELQVVGVNFIASHAVNKLYYNQIMPSSLNITYYEWPFGHSFSHQVFNVTLHLYIYIYIEANLLQMEPA
jgi:hypothetical protein